MASTVTIERATVLPNGAFDDGSGVPISPVRIEFGGFTQTVDPDNPSIQYRTQFTKGVNYDDIAPGVPKTALDAFLADFSGADDLIATLFPVV